MRKRAALIRTLVYDPPMILMDEPFGAVDAQTRTQLQGDLLRLWSLKRKTIIFVTHDITEAIALGDRALVLTPTARARSRPSIRSPIPRPRDVKNIFTHAGLHRDLRAHPGGRAMSSADIASGFSESRAIPRQWIVTGGRVLLGLALIAAWEMGRAQLPDRCSLRRRLRPRSGSGRWRRAASSSPTPSRRLRVSALGFVIGCACGIGLPFLLRLSERLTQAIEPFILASMGIPKICADALAHSLVRHRRPAEGDRRDAVRVLHRVHHGVCRHAQRRSAADQHGARGRRERARHRPQGDLGVAAAVLLHRPEGGAAAGGQRRDRRRVPGRDRGHRLFDRAAPGSSPTPPACSPASSSRWRWCW